MKIEGLYKIGFVYDVRVFRPDGTEDVKQREEMKNLVPMQGINNMIDTWLNQAAQVSTWYVGLYRGNYTPNISDTMLTFPGAATEATEYVDATRKTLTLGTTTNGQAISTVDSLNFEASANVTIYGGFVSSNSVKGSTVGVLASAVRFSSPKILETGAVLKVTAGFVVSPA